MEIRSVIEKAGGFRVVAGAFNLSPQAVYDWDRQGRVPPKHVYKLARMAKVKPESVNPEMFA